MGEEIDEVLTLDQKRRELLQQTETMKAQRNAASKKIGEAKRNGESADAAIKETRELCDKIKELDQQIEANDEQLHDKMAHLPNIPHDGVPVSLTEEGAVELRKVGKIRDFDFEPKHHWDVGENLGILETSLGNSQVLPRDYFNQVERVCTRISDRNIRELIYPKGVLKMTYSRNRYDQDFKKNAVRLSFNSSKPVKIIASELGVPESALYRWRKLYTEDGKQTPFASLEAENRALKRENAELALERDMLKKAAAYFASLQK
ncbi:seryl-tRNA synthetase [Lacticaseibacillus casei A2-362]|nr:seryl-tRNA synthetase [Lacticaseibacillus casei A2-362]